MSDPIRGFRVVPSYNKGMIFNWELPAQTSLSDQKATKYQVEVSATGTDGWKPYTAELANVLQLSGPSERERSNFHLELNFRLKVSRGGRVWYSRSVDAYGGLPKREFLMAQAIMRRELLSFKTTNGLEVDVWRRGGGEPCTACTDEVSGARLTVHCKDCHGSGTVDGYHGPYRTWATITTSTTDSTKIAPESAGTDDDRMYKIRQVSWPVLRRDDVIVELRGDRRYRVIEISHVAELRLHPIVQEAQVLLLPYDHPSYLIGS